jgi:hypothetical protein
MDNPIKVPKEIAAQCDRHDQRERFDTAMDKILSLSPKRAGEIRKAAAHNPTPQGRQPKGVIPASRVPVKILPD